MMTIKKPANKSQECLLNPALGLVIQHALLSSFDIWLELPSLGFISDTHRALSENREQRLASFDS